MKVIGFAGWSGSGKTTLIERVIGIVTARGIRVSLIKHAHHAFDVDHEGKDSWRHRHAGCGEVLISSGKRWALMHELKAEPEPTLDELLAKLSDCDLAIVEGFKRAPIPKVEIYRESLGKPKLFPGDSHIIAVVTDSDVDTALPCVDINNPEAVADFVLEHCGLSDVRVQ